MRRHGLSGWGGHWGLKRALGCPAVLGCPAKACPALTEPLLRTHHRQRLVREIRQRQEQEERESEGDRCDCAPAVPGEGLEAYPHGGLQGTAPAGSDGSGVRAGTPWPSHRSGTLHSASIRCAHAAGTQVRAAWGLYSLPPSLPPSIHQQALTECLLCARYSSKQNIQPPIAELTFCPFLALFQKDCEVPWHL